MQSSANLQQIFSKSSFGFDMVFGGMRRRAELIKKDDDLNNEKIFPYA